MSTGDSPTGPARKDGTRLAEQQPHVTLYGVSYREKQRDNMFQRYS